MSSVLDEKLVMDSDVVGEVLHRRIPPQELSESRDSLDFGVMPASLMETEIVTNPSSESRSRDIVCKKGKLWSEKNDGMVQWGVRRQVNEDTEKKERNEEGGGEEEGAGGRGEEEGGGGGGEQENQRNEEENDEEIARRTRKRKFHSYYGARFIQITTLISRNTNHHMVEDLSNKQGDGDLAIVTTPISCDTNPNMKRDEKELFHELVKRKAKLEEQLVQVSHSLQKIEEEMGQLDSAIQMQRSYEKKVELIGEEEKNKETSGVGGGGEHELVLQHASTQDFVL